MPTSVGPEGGANPLTATDVEDLEVPTIDAPMSRCEKAAVPIVFTIFVVFRAADRVFMKTVQNDLGATSYSLMFTNVIWPAAMQVITFCIIFGYVMKQRLAGNNEYNLSFFKLNQPLASSTGPIPTYMLALFSLGDQLNGAISAPAAPFVSQPIQSVMTNFILIWMAFVAYFWISVRYKWCHFAGMALVMVSCFVQFLPNIIDNDCEPAGVQAGKCFSAYHTPLCLATEPECEKGSYLQFDHFTTMLFFYALFVVSTFPAAVSNVYKQKVLQGVDADIFYVTWWSGWFQLLWGWCCIPLIWIPLPSQETLTPGQTWSTLMQTLSCLAGNPENVDSHTGGSTCVENTPPWVYVLMYFAFNATFNLCITWLILRISATWVQVATVLCLNLCNVLSTQGWIVGKANAEPMGAYDWAAAVIVSFALVVYNLQPEVTADGKEILMQANGSFVSDGHANLVEKLSGTTPTGSFVKPGSFVGKA